MVQKRFTFGPSTINSELERRIRPFRSAGKTSSGVMKAKRPLRTLIPLAHRSVRMGTARTVLYNMNKR